MSRPCEHCGEATTQRYCDDDCRRADKTGTGPKACAFIAGYESGWCDWHDQPVRECIADDDQDDEACGAG